MRPTVTPGDDVVAALRTVMRGQRVVLQRGAERCGRHVKLLDVTT